MKIARSGFIAVFLLLTGLISLRAQVNASFTVNYQGINCTPATVSFTNTSTGIAPLSFEWNFGINSGVNSTLTHPSVTYLGCGTFKVVLKVTNGLSEVAYDTVPVTIYCTPKANISTSALTGCLPLNVQFTDVSIQGSGAINNSFWDFGDGNTGSGTSPIHLYTISGCKNVTLIITDTNGCTDDTTINNLICVKSKPKASFTSSATNSCGAPFIVNYRSTSTGTNPMKYQWTFNGGTPSNSVLGNPSVTYNTAGLFDVRLVVTDSAGCTDTIQKSNYASVAGNVADFSFSGNSGCLPFVMQVSGISSSAPLSWSWTTNPAAIPSSANTQDATFTFNDAETYQVCLAITYSGNCIANKCTTVTVNNIPEASFMVSGNIPTCKPPLTVDYTNTSSVWQGLTYQWLFPGGIPDTSSLPNPPSVVYPQCGSYHATLIVSSGPSCTDTFSMQDVANIDCPSSQFTASPATGCTPLLTTFNSTGIIGSPAFWKWNFGDTSNPDSVQSTIPNPTHLFTDIGCYTVRLIVGNLQGCVDTLIDSNVVCVGIRPKADFTASPVVTCAYQKVSFTNTSSGLTGNNTFAWDFLDSPPFDVLSTDKDPLYLYPDTGWFSISLITCNNGCCDTIRKDSFVHILPPIANVDVSRDCTNPMSVKLSGANAKGADTYLWSVAGGVVNAPYDSVTTVTFPADGSYQASLIVHNNLTGCNDTAIVPIDIVTVKANFVSSDTNVCLPNKVCFSNQSVNTVSYQWKIFDSSGRQKFSLTQRQPCVNFSIPDDYDIILIAADTNRCTDTVKKIKYISVHQLNLSLAGDITSGCIPLSVVFSSGTTSTGNIVASYLWDFGDTLSGTLDTSTLANPTHTYTSSGYYNVTLIAADEKGCMDTLQMPQYIHAIKPRISFSADTTVCLGQQVCFDNSSTGRNLSYQWDFGDNKISSVTAPCHPYDTAGKYGVTLIGTDKGGCTDTLYKTDYIHVTNPQADFAPDSAASSCPPLKVTFRNLSAGTDNTTEYEWLFGDGSNSDVKHPFHIYNQAGYFDVTLIISNSSGCTDTIRYDSLIHVSGASATYTVTPDSGCAPLNVCFIAHSGSAAVYTWDFGNGNVHIGADSSVCYEYTSQGIYYPAVILNDGAGCIYSFPLDTVTVGGPVVLWRSSNTTICDSGWIQFNDLSISYDTITGYKWLFSERNKGLLDSSVIQNPVYFFDTAGVYTVTLSVTTKSGCIGSFYDTILVTANPGVFISAPDSACVETAVTFTDFILHLSTVTSLRWNFGDPLSGTNNTSVLRSPQHTYYNPGIYTVTLIVLSSGGCEDTATVYVTVLESPSVLLTNNTTVCKGLSVQLNASGGDDYLWSPSMYLDNPTVANPNCTPLATVTYTVTGFNTFGCADAATVTVDLYLPAIKTVSQNVNICKGRSAQLNASGGSAYSWIPGDGLNHSGIANPVATPNSTTTYQVIVFDSICSSADTLPVVVTVLQLPTASAGPDGVITVGESYPIQATATDSVLWTPAASLSCTTCEDPVASPIQTTVYTLTTISSGGCRNSDEVIVTVICNGESLYIPNIFSPNGDGKNDAYSVNSEGKIRLTYLRIYNRWGEMVFETDEWNQGWDGTFKGQQLPPAVYVYYLQALCDNGDIIKRQGNITLVR